MLNMQGAGGFVSLDTLHDLFRNPTAPLVAAGREQPRSRIKPTVMVPKPVPSSAPVLMTDYFDKRANLPGPADIPYGPFRLGI